MLCAQLDRFELTLLKRCRSRDAQDIADQPLGTKRCKWTSLEDRCVQESQEIMHPIIEQNQQLLCSERALASPRYQQSHFVALDFDFHLPTVVIQADDLAQFQLQQGREQQGMPLTRRCPLFEHHRARRSRQLQWYGRPRRPGIIGSDFGPPTNAPSVSRRPTSRETFNQQLIVVRQEIGQVGIGAKSSIHAQDGAPALSRCEREEAFEFGQDRNDRGRTGGGTRKQQ